MNIGFLEMKPEWIRKPENVVVTGNSVEIITERGTDLWARTYYGFQNDNAPVLQIRNFFLLMSKHSLKARTGLTSAGLLCI